MVLGCRVDVGIRSGELALTSTMNPTQSTLVSIALGQRNRNL